MVYLLLYVFIYCNADDFLNTFYLTHYSAFINNELIQSNPTFHYSVTQINSFALYVYLIHIIKSVFYYNPNNKCSIALALVYIKYILNALLRNSMTVGQHEFSRSIMWLFATPLMLKMYCDINNVKLRQINFSCHIIPVFINIFIYPLKYTRVYYTFTGVAWLFFLVFMGSLYRNRALTFTNIFLLIWCVFICINLIDTFQLADVYTINMYYSYADMMSKLMSSIIINDYNEHQSSQNHNMDLQSVQFVSYLVQSINQYRADNAAITSQCSAFIESTSRRLLINIPENKIALEQELLKKILPFDLDTEYITKPDAATSPSSRQFGMICILFTDIVNYTELARKYDDTVIFQLLYTIYHRFDAIIKRYPHLQKVETIGDAYMVVGDIFRNTINHKVVVKEIMQFALTIIQEIKTIKTPDNKPLSLRIGINLGKVSVGILGNEIPRLCVVGNAVNVAARLQSTADVNTIQFSRHIYEQIKDIEFDVQHEITIKENVFLKNLGSVTTFNINPFSGDKL